MVNFGIVKNQVAHQVGQLRLRGDKAGAESLCQDFLTTVKRSPVLMLEYVTFRNLEKNSGFPTQQAYQYIDDHVRLLGRYNRNEIIKENEHLQRFVGEGVHNPQDLVLTESIQTLILESAARNNGAIPDVDALHQALHIVAEHVTQAPASPEPIKESEVTFTLPKGVTLEQVYTRAYSQLNERIQELPEDHRIIVETVMKGSEKEKEALFENLRSKAIQQLQELNVSSEDLRNEANEQLTQLRYNPRTLTEDIAWLCELLKD